MLRGGSLQGEQESEAPRGRSDGIKGNCFKVGETPVVLHSWEQSRRKGRTDDVRGRER